MNGFTSIWKAFVAEEDGIGTLEMLLIVAVILGCAIAFRKWIFEWINELFKDTNSQVTEQFTEDKIGHPGEN